MEDLRLTEDPLDVNAAFAFVTEPATGATSIFVGTTRWAMHCNINNDFHIFPCFKHLFRARRDLSCSYPSLPPMRGSEAVFLGHKI
jgi:hypothetical protein